MIVVDVASGKAIGQITDQGTNPVIAWATVENKGENVVLVATGMSVDAFRVDGASSVPGSSRR